MMNPSSQISSSPALCNIVRLVCRNCGGIAGWLFVIVAVSVCVPSCAAAEEEEQPIVPEAIELGRPVDFQKDIYPMLQANCIACHNKAKSEGELNLETSETILKGGSSGEIIVPGKPDESYLYQVAARIEESFMPPMPNGVQAKKLTPRQVGLLRQWITEGAKISDTSASTAMQWQPISNQLNAIYAVDTDPFGRFVAAGRAGNVNIYDLLMPNAVVSLADPALVEFASASQKAHRDYVHSVAYHPGGQMVATSGYRVVKLWQRDTAGTLAPVALPAATSNLVHSADSTIAAAHQADGVIRVLDAKSNAVVNEIAGQDPATTRLLGIYGPENQWIAVGLEDTTVKLISRADGAVVAAGDALGARAAGAAYVAGGNKLIVLQDDGALRPLTLDPAAKTLMAAEPVTSEKGSMTAIHSAGNVLLTQTESAVELRNAETLAVNVTIPVEGSLQQSAISADAQRVTTIDQAGAAKLWNAADGKPVAALSADFTASQSLTRQTAEKVVRDARVTVVKGQITEDEKRVTEQKESLKKSDEEIKKATEALVEPKKKLEEAVAKTATAKKASEEKADDEALKKAVTEAEKAEKAAADAVTAAENALKSANKGKELTQQAIQRAEAKVEARKNVLAQVEAEAKAATEAHAAAETQANTSVVSRFAAFLSADIVATLDADGTARLWKSADGSAADVFPTTVPEASRPSAVAGVAGGILVQQADGKLGTISSVAQWKLHRVLGPPTDGGESAFVDRVLTVAFSPDGQTLAAGGGEASRSGELTLWNVNDGTLIRSFTDAHSDTVYGVDFSADGKLIASAAADKFVKVFNVATGEHVRSYEGHTHHVMDVSWKGDGTALVSAGADNAIKVWNAETGEQSRTITTYKKQVTSLEFVGMEDEFISSSGDKRVFRHKASNGGTVREFKGCPDYVYCSATTPDGSVVAAGCEDGILRVWNGKDGKELTSFSPTSN